MSVHRSEEFVLYCRIALEMCTRNLLTFVKTTPIAYGQNLEAPGKFSPICNSSRFYKRLEITSSISYCTRRVLFGLDLGEIDWTVPRYGLPRGSTGDPRFSSALWNSTTVSRLTPSPTTLWERKTGNVSTIHWKYRLLQHHHLWLR